MGTAVIRDTGSDRFSDMLFFDLCDEDTMDSRTALKRSEYATYHLSECSEEEKQAVLQIIAKMRQAAVARGDRATVEILDQIPLDAWPEEEDEEARGA